MMRIAYVSQFPNMVGGGEHSLLDLMCHVPSSVEPVFITPSEGELTEQAKACGIKHVSLPMLKLVQFKPSILQAWVKALQVIKPDVIHANNSRAAFYAGLAGRKLHIPVVFHCRIAQPDALMDGILKRLVGTVICNSQSVAARFQSYAKPVHVIYNGLNVTSLPNLANPLPSADKYMLFVGRITPEKQLEHALKVFADLAAQDEGLHFVVLGEAGPDDNGYMQGIKDECKQHAWCDRVHFLGYHDDVTPWYAHAQYLILTSKHEGFGRVLVEAMSQACPVVTYAVGGVPEVFEDGEQGFLIAPNDVQAMSQACKRLLEDKSLNTSMGQAGVKHAQNFSIETHVSQVVSVYQGLVSEASAVKVMVDGREFVFGRRTGIGRFLEGLLLALANQHPDWLLQVILDEPNALPISLQDKVVAQQAPKHLEWHWPALTKGFDLFLSPYPKRPLRMLPCPSIHTIHDVFYLTHPAYQGNSLRRMAGLWRLKQAVSSASLTWFDSKVSQDETEKLVGDITHDTAIRFPAIEASFKPDRRVKKKDFFLFVGNGLPHKNVQILLGAMKGTDIHLKCVGIRQDVADKLLHMFQPEEGQVEFLQDVDDVALLKLYRQSKALLQPSTAEGYGYPPLEAFACGTSAIVSDIPVLRETTGGFASYCPPHDAQAWRNVLTTFEADTKMVEQGLTWAKAHQGKRGWAKHIQDIEQLVNR